MYITDAMFCFNWISPSVEHVLGWRPDDLVGRPTSSVQLPEDRAQRNAIRTRVFGERRVVDPVNIRFRMKSGAVRWMSVRAHPLGDGADGRRPVVVTFRDVQNEVLERRATDTVSAGNALLARADDEADLLEAMCETAVSVGGYAFAWYGRRGPARQEGRVLAEMLPVASSAGRREYLQGLKAHVAGGPLTEGPTARAARTGRTTLETDIADADDGAPWRSQALAAGFRSSASLPVRVDGELDGVFTVYAVEHDAFDEHAVAVLQDLARTLGFGMGRLRDRSELHQAFASSIDLVAAVVESRDPYTAGHQSLVAELALAIGVELGLDDHRLDGLSFGARIHDVGKIGVPIDILCRPGALNPEEMAVVRRHATIGYEIAGHFTWPWPVADIVHQHHEHYDGSGYPQGLQGDGILLEARILAVADAYQAIASRRPYREALGEDTAYRIILEGSGSQFDPEVVEAFVRVLAGGFAFSSPRWARPDVAGGVIPSGGWR